MKGNPMVSHENTSEAKMLYFLRLQTQPGYRSQKNTNNILGHDCRRVHHIISYVPCNLIKGRGLAHIKPVQLGLVIVILKIYLGLKGKCR